MFNRFIILLKVSTDSYAHSQFQKTNDLIYYIAVPTQHGKLDAFKNPLQDFIYIIYKMFFYWRLATLIILIFVPVEAYHLIQIPQCKYLMTLDFHSYHFHPIVIDIDQGSFPHSPIQILSVHLNQ